MYYVTTLRRNTETRIEVSIFKIFHRCAQGLFQLCEFLFLNLYFRIYWDQQGNRSIMENKTKIGIGSK